MMSNRIKKLTNENVTSEARQNQRGDKKNMRLQECQNAP